MDDWDQLLQLIQDGKVQIVAQVPCDYTFAAERDLTITNSYASSPYALTAETGFQSPAGGQRLALVAVNSYAGDYYAGDVIRYAHMGECIEAVGSREADYTYLDLYTAQYYWGDFRYSNLKRMPQSYAPRFVCFGLAKPTDYELLSILNKSIHLLSAVDLQHIIT